MMPTIRLRFSPTTPKLRARVYPGIPPLQAEFRNNGTTIQWRVGASGAWTDLVDLIDIAGPVAGIIAGTGIAVDSSDLSHPIVALSPANVVRDYLDAAPYVATRTALKALVTAKDTAAYLTEVGREGTFIFMAGDYSTQVTADTLEGIYIKADDTATSAGAWVRVYANSASVKWFGAVGDSSTDDSAAIQAAFNNVRDISFPEGTYVVATALTIGNGNSTTISTKNGFVLRGKTSGTTAAETSPTIYPVCLKWTGASSAVMLTINGPVTGVNMSGICFDCNALAGTGVRARHMMVSTWQDIVVTKNTGIGIILESYPTFSGMVQGANKDTFTNVRVVNAAGGGHGIRVGNTAATLADILDVAQNVFINCDFGRDGTSGASFSIYLAFCDNCTFIECQTHGTGGSSGTGVYVNPPTGTSMTTFPNEILFLNCPTIGGWLVDVSWAPPTGIIVDPFPTSDGEAIPTSAFVRGRTFDQGFFPDVGLLGSSSGSTRLKAFATASGTLTLPAATDTLVGKATTDTLTNKTLDTAGTGNSLKINGVAASDNTGTGAVVRASAIREKLSGARTYYVRSDGSDSNTGLANTSGGAFLTIQKAIDVVAALDIGIYTVTIQCADATYTGNIRVTGPWVGTGTVNLIGNITTPANCVITSGTTLQVSGGGRLSINGFQVQASSIGLSAIYNGVITLGANMRFGACTTYHMEANFGGIIQGNSYAIVGAAGIHLRLDNGVAVFAANAITLTGTLAFTYFVEVTDGGVLSHFSTTWTGGTITGQRYTASLNGVINTFGGGASVFPGNSAGATATGGQYA